MVKGKGRASILKGKGSKCRAFHKGQGKGKALHFYPLPLTLPWRGQAYRYLDMRKYGSFEMTRLCISHKYAYSGML